MFYIGTGLMVIPLIFLAVLASLDWFGFKVHLNEAFPITALFLLVGAIYLLIACLGLFLKRRKAATTPRAEH
jgi:hypothetical protein